MRNYVAQNGWYHARERATRALSVVREGRRQDAELLDAFYGGWHPVLRKNRGARPIEAHGEVKIL